MNPWQAMFFGLKQIPRELTAFEIEAFFTFTAAERQVIEQRRRPALKLGLALQIGFLRMSGRVLDAVRVVPAVLWRNLGEQFKGVTLQSWLWAPPAKHSTRQIEELLERIATLHELGIQRHFADVPDDLLRRAQCKRPPRREAN
jgi:hypothetical protein